ncbi:uncharacterized protein DCS_00136 [Drechmeria coniospora]|uniref:Retinoblastoma-binding protein n=1 Tax=Drechmeria coniospora TaxID=98403 RepID=A0A151GPH4_DRECN|nr:uncharacterized protein DCS_00136 [Drechmeria coniospora]KYK59009.1 uncharacterized protein DCS_00136 [Drechmeria coniospora]
MSSSVFFKFKSQKEPTRVEFDGTGISVFELKREIISKSGLGDGTDFDLFIYTDDGSDEYDDDTTIVPRSTTVIARRQPAAKPGAGRAARYISGKAPVSAKNSGRREQAAKATAAKPSASAINQMNSAMTEEEKMAAMFAAQSEQWSAQQEEMSHQAPVFNKGGIKRPANVPDHDPPAGYICYRCGNKGHWIQMCPTNDDPEFDNRPRVKRTTGIPRSFLQKVDKAVVMAQSDGDESKRPSGIMVNAEGDFVIAEPDKASWERFQAKTKSSGPDKEVLAENKEVQERGLECSIDRKMFIEPMKTPCCQKTFCNDCITNAVIESDFVCPACQTEGVLIDDLIPDEETSRRIQEYLKEREAAKTPRESPKPEPVTAAEPAEPDAQQVQPTLDSDKTEANDADSKEATKSPTPAPTTARSPPKVAEAKSGGQGVEAEADKAAEAKSAEGIIPNAKKRPATDVLENPNIPKGPKAMLKQQAMNSMPNMMNNGVPNMGIPNMMFNGMPMMPNMMGMPPNMGMGMGMGMPMMGMPMMGMPGFGGMNGGWGMNGMNGMNNMNGMNMNGMNGMSMPGGPMGGGPMSNGMGAMGGFQNGANFGQQANVDDEDAYFRKPINPHRHQNKQRRARPSDYREL